MPTYSLRCRLNACRHRRVSRTHPDDLKRRVRCTACGGMHGWRIEAREYNRRNLCNCSSVEMASGKRFPHRTHHPLCEQNPWGEFNRAAYMGVAVIVLGWMGPRPDFEPDHKERRHRPTLDWPFIHAGRRMNPDDPCPF